ncbi:hypothetical protein [Rubritalea tangerina]|uniref:DUF4177 domain-containing protein n=1 Tax=Rubritalea tangerina TaxID=430798 RepID=A0ABW4ZD79_9BACT
MKPLLKLPLFCVSAVLLTPVVYAQNAEKPAVEGSQQTKEAARERRAKQTRKVVWEYKAVHVPYSSGNDREAEAITARANEMGADGWNLVSSVKSHSSSQLLLLFKRPKM